MELELTALHETSHATTAVVFGAKTVDVKLKQHGADWSGSCWHAPELGSRLDEIAVALSGVVAQYLSAGKPMREREVEDVLFLERSAEDLRRALTVDPELRRDRAEAGVGHASRLLGLGDRPAGPAR